MIDYQKKQQESHVKLFAKVTPKEFNDCLELVKSKTMLSAEVLYDLWNTVKYITAKGLTGDVLEFGVWKGGGLEMACHALNRFNGKNKVYGFDTFEGHPEPSKNEVDAWGNNMNERFHKEIEENGSWVKSHYDSVLKHLTAIRTDVTLRKGEVTSETIEPEIEKISILRLDMDWYEPTMAALVNFYDRVQHGGSIIIDDYGHHSGAREATDEFFAKRGLHLNFRHINYSCIAATVC
jgi:O-methyltransferase